MEEKRRLVVIDAANILRDDRGCIIRDKDGNRLTQMRPERLMSVISIVEENGGEPIALLRDGTYFSGKKKSKSEDPRYGDWDLVESAIAENKVLRVSDDDDMYCVHSGLQNNALIITRDKFRDHKKSHPEIDWNLVSNLKVSDYNFIKDDFVSPSLINKLKEEIPPNSNLTTEGQDIETPQNVITPEQEETRTNETTPATNDFSPIPSDVDEIILLDELYAVIYSLTSDDGQCNLSAVVEQLAAEFLEREGTASVNKWAAGWPKELKKYINSITGENHKVTKWIGDNLPTGFEVRRNGKLVRFD